MQRTRSRTTRAAVAAGTFASLVAGLALVGPASPAGATSTKKVVTGLATIALDGKAGNNASTGSATSLNGRFIAFDSTATNLVSGDTKGLKDVFVRDTLAATTERISVSSGGAEANGESSQASISSNGRYVAFKSEATNLVAGDTNGQADVFLRDRVSKTTVRVSLRDDDAQINGGLSEHPVVSDDGAEVAFESAVNGITLADGNAAKDVFIRNVAGKFTERVTVNSGELGLTAGGGSPAMSGNGRYVVFDSTTTQVDVDTNGNRNAYLRDRVLGTTEVVSLHDNETYANLTVQFPVVSDDGRYVAFQTKSKLTASNDAVDETDVFRRDRATGSTILVSRTDADAPSAGGGAVPDISSDGNRIVFSSDGTDLVGTDSNGVTDVFVRNITAGTTTRQTLTTNGAELNGLSFSTSISPDGGTTSFSTLAKNGYDKDANNTFDVFWRGTYQTGPYVDSTGTIQRSAHDFTGSDLALGPLFALNDKVLYGTASPESTIDDFAHGTWDDKRGPVMRLYWAFFERMPDLNGLNYWVNKYTNGMTLKQIANSFAKSSEFTNKYGSLDNTAFVTLVYQNVLERNPDSAGLAHWVGRLEDGVSRGEMMTGFSESSEGIRRMRGEIDTVLVVLGMLHRLPTPAEFPSMVALLEGSYPQPTEVLITSVLTSSAYAATV